MTLKQSDLHLLAKEFAKDNRTPMWVVRRLVQTPISEIEIEYHTFAKSYTDFLLEQIELQPRGPEWTKVLASRYHAFQPVVGQLLLRVDAKNGDDDFVGHIRVLDSEIIHIEYFENNRTYTS